MLPASLSMPSCSRANPNSSWQVGESFSNTQPRSHLLVTNGGFARTRCSIWSGILSPTAALTYLLEEGRGAKKKRRQFSHGRKTASAVYLNRVSWAGAPSWHALASTPVSTRSAANGESEVMVNIYIFLLLFCISLLNTSEAELHPNRTSVHFPR